MIALLVGVVAAQAADRVVVHTGDTIEAIAQAAGDPSAAAAIRSENGLAPGEQPAPGVLLVLPTTLAGVSQDGAVLSVSGGGGTAMVTGVGTARLVPTMPLPAGSRVCTDIDGYATLRLASALEGNFHDDITLLPNTCLTIQSTASRPSSRSSVVALDQGSVTVSQPSPGDTPGNITVSTTAGVTSAEGGGFRVHVEAEGARTEALYTDLSVFGGGVEQPLDAGQGSRVREGEAPGAPVDLLPAGSPVMPAEGATLRRPDFSWIRVETALGYQLELAQSPDFRDMLLVQTIDRPAWEPDRLLLPGDVEGIWWQVATVDRHGFIGIPSPPRRLALPAGVGP